MSFVKSHYRIDVATGNYVFYKILNSMSSKYLISTIPSITRRYASRNANNMSSVRFSKYFINTFFPSTVTEWNKLVLNIQNLTSDDISEGNLYPLENNLYTCQIPIGTKSLSLPKI